MDWYGIFNLKMIASTLFLALVANALLWIYKRYRALHFFERHGIPGPKPKLLSGNMYDLRKHQTPKDTIEVWLKQYGNVFGYYLGDRPHLVVNDVEIIKQVMIKEFPRFSERPKMFLKVKPLIDCVLCQGGRRWKEVRSVLTPTFSSNKMKQMVDTIDKQVNVLVDVTRQFAETGQTFDIYERVQALTVDVIGVCALAMNINSQGNPNDPFLRAVRDFFAYAHNSAVEAAIFFPFLRPVMEFVSNYLTAGRMTDMVVRNLKNVINFRLKHPNTAKDLLQLLLDSSESDVGSEQPAKKKAKLTYDEIIANCHISLLAGYETTATALAFTINLLVNHPEIQEHIYEEVSRDLLDNPSVTYDMIQKWQYLDQVFQESLRIYPPVTGFLTRECLEDVTINGLFIPKGVIVEAPVWQIHHDPALWPDPYKFDPDRFAPENKSNIHPAAFLPFGIGPRNCLGMRFAQIEAKLALAKLIFKYKLLPSDKMENPLQLLCSTVITAPKNGVHIKIAFRD